MKRMKRFVALGAGSHIPLILILLSRSFLTVLIWVAPSRLSGIGKATGHIYLTAEPRPIHAPRAPEDAFPLIGVSSLTPCQWLKFHQELI